MYKITLFALLMAAVVLAACAPAAPQQTVARTEIANPDGSTTVMTTTVSTQMETIAAAPVVPSAAGGFRLLAEGECAPASAYVVMKDYVRASSAAKIYAFTTDASSTDVCRGVFDWGWRVVWQFADHQAAVDYAQGEYTRVVAVSDADPSGPGSNPATVIELWFDGVQQ